MASKRMSAGNINMQTRSMQVSNSLNARAAAGSSQSKIKATAAQKKISQSSSVNPTERENAHKVQTFLDEASHQFLSLNGQGGTSAGMNQAHSLTRNNRDY